MSGILAQLGEHLPYKQRVTGSSPVGPISIVYGSQMFENSIPLRGTEPCHKVPSASLTPYDVCRCGSTAEQLICNQQVISSNLIIG